MQKFPINVIVAKYFVLFLASVIVVFVVLNKLEICFEFVVILLYLGLELLSVIIEISKNSLLTTILVNKVKLVLCHIKQRNIKNLG